MVNINISIKEEAYEFLRTLKGRNKSFSEVILEFKGKKGNKDVLMSFFGGLANKGIDWDVKEKRMKEFRESFNKRIKTTTKEREPV